MTDRHIVYFPQCYAVLTVPYFGKTQDTDAQAHGADTIDIPIRVEEATLTINNHLQADTLSVTTTWQDAGVDPRLIKSATIQFWMGDAGFDRAANDDLNFRFLGICHSVDRISNETGGMRVQLEFQDYTSIFLNMKPFPTDGIPSYTDDLKTAWAKICKYTGFYDKSTDTIVSSVEVLSDKLYFKGLNNVITLGDSIPERIKKLGKMPIKEEQSAWDVWQVCCGMLGLISYIDRDKVIVTTTTDHFTLSQDKPPGFIWGRNILEASEKVQATFSAKGIGLTSFNPLTGKVIESFYPPPGDKRIHIKRSKAKSKHFDPKAVASDHYDMMEYNGTTVTSEQQLFGLAHRVYDERARQEIQGKFSTHEMAIPLINDQGKDVDYYDIMDLRAGDAIEVRVDGPVRDNLLKLGDPAAQIKYLTDTCGYSAGVANLFVKSIQGYQNLRAIYHIKQAVFKISGDKWSADIEYQNLIDVRGYADAPLQDVELEDDEAKKPNAVVPPPPPLPPAPRGHVGVVTGIVDPKDEPVAPGADDVSTFNNTKGPNDYSDSSYFKSVGKF